MTIDEPSNWICHTWVTCDVPLVLNYIYVNKWRIVVQFFALVLLIFRGIGERRRLKWVRWFLNFIRGFFRISQYQRIIFQYFLTAKCISLNSNIWPQYLAHHWEILQDQILPKLLRAMMMILPNFFDTFPITPIHSCPNPQITRVL